MARFWQWIEAEDYRFSVWLFLRSLGLIYLIAFSSLAAQIKGLIGSEGILPIAELIKHSAHFIPSLFWFNQDDAFLMGTVYLGIGFAVLQILNIAPKFMLLALWIIYLSIVNVGQVFLSYQWDVLLLETGFLAIFLAPLWENPRKIAQSIPNRAFIYLIWWLVFRLMFASGALKLLAGDPTWANFTALSYHYETQPLPNPLAYYAHQLPMIFQNFSVLMVYFNEIIVPFCIFMPRPLRHFGATMMIGLQVLILLTGNFAFFNWLSIVLCLLLFDDRFWKRSLGAAKTSKTWQSGVVAISASLLFILSTGVFLSQFGLLRMPEPLAAYRLANRYGLFIRMTTEHPTLIIEGSYDGETWQAYSLRWQPQDISKMPPIVAPHQPRLDWQLWFAALGSIQQNDWLLGLVDALENGSPDALALFENSPFPTENPPPYIRILIYDYRFGSETWWERTYLGEYFVNKR